MKNSFTFFFLLSAMVAGAQVNHNWCGTEVPASYRAEYNNTDRNGFEAYAAARSSIQWVGIWYHIIAKDDGSGGTDLKKVFETHCEMNEAFNQFNIGFYIVNIDTIKNTVLWNYQNQNLGWSAFNSYNESNVCNVYVNGNLPGLCGFATFPNTAPKGGGIFMNGTDCMGAGTTTLHHEMGHYLGLLHTFDDGNGVEYVNGTNCASAGDLFCDTPADFLDQRTPCPYNGNQTDPNGDLYKNVIDESLYMSYFSDACTNRFSNEQIAEMVFVLNNKRSNLLNQPLPDLSALDSAVIITPKGGDTSVVSNSITFSWNKVDRARYYIFRAQSATSNVVYADTLISDTTFTIIGLLPNKSYKFRVKGISYGNTCAYNTNYQFIKTSTIKAAASITGPSCSGQNDAAINVTPTNGVAPYAVSWSSGASGAGLQNIGSGSYTATITDNSGEVAVVNYTIADPAAIGVDITRVGNNLNAYANGGTAPYTYAWSNGVTGQFNNNVSFGSYTVTITDSKGCTFEKTFTYSPVGILSELREGLKVFPNPVQRDGVIEVHFELSEAAAVSVQVFNVNGTVMSEIGEQFSSGVNKVRVTPATLSSGVYFIRLSTARGTATQRITVL